eukprot:gb/GECG01001684.1/.p1 GENE.gb/GECG01001684.1/~~gb/GECG01001684.1/.p1  ORF type:complete len:117 (+),score=11.10 gb/GECG01001684.1/:1-351(+)
MMKNCKNEAALSRDAVNRPKDAKIHELRWEEALSDLGSPRSATNAEPQREGGRRTEWSPTTTKVVCGENPKVRPFVVDKPASNLTKWPELQENQHTIHHDMICVIRIGSNELFIRV